ncbi:hypothetical protein U1Q18_006662 [Sarracenia purpurea var. burkii]
MKKENLASFIVGEPTGRITRARAAACRPYGEILPSKATKQPDQKQIARTNSKRAAVDESSAPVIAGVQNKRRAVLKDVTNVCCNSYRNCLIAAEVPKNNSKRARNGSVKISKVAPSNAVQMQQLPPHLKSKGAQKSMKKELKSSEVECSMKWENSIPCESETDITMKGHADNPHIGKQNMEVLSQTKRGCLLYQL